MQESTWRCVWGDESYILNLTSLDSLLVLRLCCIARDSAMSVTGLWIFFRSPLYFTCKRNQQQNNSASPLKGSFRCLPWWMTGGHKYNPKYTPHLQVHWHPSESDKSYCSSDHTGVSFLWTLCQTSPYISPFPKRKELLDNARGTASCVTQRVNSNREIQVNSIVSTAACIQQHRKQTKQAC